jgi:hypothetical protein
VAAFATSEGMSVSCPLLPPLITVCLSGGDALEAVEALEL